MCYTGICEFENYWTGECTMRSSFYFTKKNGEVVNIGNKSNNNNRRQDNVKYNEDNSMEGELGQRTNIPF